MYKKRGLGFFVVLTIFLVASSSSALADFCMTDEDCAFLGDTWACDPILSECVSLDFPELAEEGLIDESTMTNDEVTLFEDLSAMETADTEMSDSVDPVVASDLGSSSSGEEIDSRLTGVEESVQDLSTQMQELSETVENINTNVQLLSTDQHQLEREIEEQVNTIESEVLSGLAILQDEVETTKTELQGTKEEVEASAARASFFRTLSVVGVLAVVVAAIMFFLRTHKREEEKEVPSKVKDYITSQIKQGVSEEQIVAALTQAGWPAHDARWAFEQTTVHNYNAFLKSQGKPAQKVPKHKVSDTHYQKIALVSILSIVLLAVMLLYMKNTVGFAVYNQGLNSEELSTLALQRLEASIDSNQFYSEIDYTEICVQVNDVDASASFRLLKTPYGHSIEEITERCDVVSYDYDFAVSFSSWNVFNSLSTSLTCTSISQANAIQPGSSFTRGFYVLPSYYIAEGFEAVPGRDYSDFCSVLSQCLSPSDIALLDVGC